MVKSMLAGLASASHAAPCSSPAADSSCEASGASVTTGADEALRSASTSCCHTNGTLMASSAMTVAANAANRTLELGWCSMGLFCTILEVGCHAGQAVPLA